MKKAEILSSGIPVALKTMSQASLEYELETRRLNTEGRSRSYNMLKSCWCMRAYGPFTFFLQAANDQYVVNRDGEGGHRRAEG